MRVQNKKLIKHCHIQLYKCRVRKSLSWLAFLIKNLGGIQNMPTKQGTDELVLIRKVGDRKDANKVMLVTELERETEKDRDTEATFDGSVNSGGTLESTVTINCYMDQKDTLCDEIEDATEDDTPYELWVINKRVQNSEGKYKAEYRQGYWNSITRTNEADGIAEFETEFGVYLKTTWLCYITASN